jgi:hypothetical protein
MAHVRVLVLVAHSGNPRPAQQAHIQIQAALIPPQEIIGNAQARAAGAQKLAVLFIKHLRLMRRVVVQQAVRQSLLNRQQICVAQVHLMNRQIR